MTTTLVSSRDQLAALIGELSDEQVDVLMPFVTDLVDALKTEDGLGEVDRDEFRENLNLKRRLPDPTLTNLAGVTLAGSEVSLADQKKAGGYAWMNSDITVERFPLTLPAGPRDLFLAHFGIDVQSEEVEAWAATNGYEVSPIDDLLAVGSHSEHKELQRQFPIIALGSFTVVDGERCVPYLGWRDSLRYLSLNLCDGGWDVYYRFLLSRKAS